MTDETTPTPPAAGNPDALPEHTTPTWEVELLISGVAVFSMLQLPGWLDERFLDLVPNLDRAWSNIINLGYVYARIAAFTLAATFVVHLFARAYWIALVGVNSIYPQGVRWEGVKMGAQLQRFVRPRLDRFADVIERADNRATIVFALGVGGTLQMLKLVAMVAVSAIAALVLGQWIRLDADALFYAVILAIVIPFLAKFAQRPEM